LGERQAIIGKDGQPDTLYHTISDFSFMNQDGKIITQNEVKNKVYLVDFFFVSCPTICPKVKKNMLKVHEHFKGNTNLLILSHSIDPRHDTVARLHDYAKRLNADTQQWQFLTGDRDSIFTMAGRYLVAAQEDSTAAGGFTHSGNVMLIDRHRRIRGYYNGLNEQDMESLIKDTELLLNSPE
jgi:protein SCO1/2